MGVTMKIVARFCLLLALSPVAWSGGDVVMLGVVEDVPGISFGEGHNTKVRAVFSHQAMHWKSFRYDCGDSECLTSLTKTYPKEVTWYVGFDGRQVGKVTARTPDEFNSYAHIGLQEIFEGSAPVIGKPSREFSGFSGKPVRRPLVAASKSNFRDPQGWKREKITPQLLMKALDVLRKNAPPLCNWPDEDKPAIPFHYTQSDLNVRAHKSTNGSLLLTVGVEGAYDCEGLEAGGPGDFDAEMFAIGSDGVVHDLGPGLVLVDAGDYDGDGFSELVTALSLYNRGGYVLFSASFSEEARFEFSYH